MIGTVLGNGIPSDWGLGFAGVLCLIGILCSLVNTPLRLLALGVAGCTAVLAYSLPLKLNIVTAIVVAVLLSFWLEKAVPRARPTAKNVHPRPKSGPVNPLPGKISRRCRCVNSVCSGTGR